MPVPEVVILALRFSVVVELLAKLMLLFAVRLLLLSTVYRLPLMPAVLLTALAICADVIVCVLPSPMVIWFVVRLRPLIFPEAGAIVTAVAVCAPVS